MESFTTRKEAKRKEQEFLLAARDLKEQTLADYYKKKESIMWKTISHRETKKS